MAANQQENVQGAPTEGLGQTVTFVGGSDQIPQPRLTESGPVMGASGLQAGGSGTGPVALHAVQNGPNPTMAILTKVMDDVAKRKLEQRRQEAFFDGMQQAAQGQAVADIVNNQPWYAKIFGDSDVAEGARAYGANAAVTNLVAKMETDMPRLRTMSNQEFSAYYNAAIQGATTGDKATDAVVLQSMTRHMPSLFTQQAKQHYAWTQENAVGQMAANFKMSASLLQTRAQGYADGIKSPEDFAADKALFFRDQIPPEGIDEPNYKKGLTAVLHEALVNGQFHAFDAYQESGVLDHLAPEQRAGLLAARAGAERAYRVQSSEVYSNDLIRVDLMARDLQPGQSVGDVLKEVDALNDRYKRATGSSIGIISEGEREGLARSGYAGILAERRRLAADDRANAKTAATEAAKAEAAAAKAANIRMAISNGTAGYLVASKGYSAEDVDAQFVDMLNGPGPDGKERSPMSKVNFLSNAFNSKFVSKTTQDLLDGGLGSAIRASGNNYGGEGSTIDSAYQQWAAINAKDPALARAYYPEYGPVMVRFDRELKRTGDKVAAWAVASNPDSTDRVAPKVLKEAVKAIDHRQSSWFGLGGYSPTGGTQEVLGSVTARYADKWASTADPKTAARQGLERAITNREIELVGDHGWEQKPDQTPLAVYLTTPGKGQPIPAASANGPIKDEAVGYFNDFIRDSFGSGHGIQGVFSSNDGFDYDTVKVFRAQDSQGVPSFVATAHGSNGTVKQIVFSGEDVRSYYWKRKGEQPTAADAKKAYRATMPLN